MKRFLTMVLAPLLCVTMAWGQKLTRSQYIEKYAATAVREMKASGIPASITLAQGCLESGNGNSTLATQANNHFGIKCHNNWNGKTVRHDDETKNECFRSYKNADESFRDHSDFLRYRDRYAFLFELEPTDYKGWAYGLQKAGYATAKTYATSLIQIIEENELWRYDQLDATARQELPPTPMQAETSTKFKPLPGHKLYAVSLSREIRTTNGVPYIPSMIMIRSCTPMPVWPRNTTSSRVSFSVSTTAAGKPNCTKAKSSIWKPRNARVRRTWTSMSWKKARPCASSPSATP